MASASVSTSKHQDHDHDSSESESNELSLSCGSSEFEIGEDGSSGSVDEIVVATGAMAGAQINPYQFEPYNSNSDKSEPEDGEDEDRLTDNSLCSCGHCAVIVDVKNEHPNTAYITDHPGFHPVCLDIHVLKVAYYLYRQQYGEHPDHKNE
ncbi:unnamed protein product [Mytilus coruscus]|uniref:Uncharacterized protein n=1 Tax=Mytilus coruscus TaxID=42192 RepID=A0A6J8E187_MYTCO|nr:unnamed protein product [Mytilus coruscus]